MALYEITADNLQAISQTTFEQVGLMERNDLQRLLKNQIEVILPGILIIAEEFGDWEESRRRVDLLGLDKNGNIIVIELKRTEDGGHMDLQAIRYAAMVSTMTFDQVVDAYQRFLHQENKPDEDARDSILNFLGWEEPLEDEFAQDVKIVLVSSNFSKEITSAIIWLNQRDLDIRCIRCIPYKDNGRILLDVQQVIPLPEAEEFQIKIREKVQKERIGISEKNNQRFKFLNNLLITAKRLTNTHNGISTPTRDNICYKSLAGPKFYYYVPNQFSTRIELYLDHPIASENKEVFDEIYKHKQEIEEKFGEPLIWQRLSDKKASRIRYDFDIGYKSDETEWLEVHKDIIEKMISLERILSLLLNKSS